MAYTKVLVVSDNLAMLKAFIKTLKTQDLIKGRTIDFVCSPKSQALKDQNIKGFKISAYDVKLNYQTIIDNYDLILSAHCKQLFPDLLTEKHRCVNIHPGLNPYNRGWFPQVFSILNKLPLGATIHEIDKEIDHGNIIAQKEVPLYAWDTSLTAYNRVQQAEAELIDHHLAAILEGNYTTKQPAEEGNLNLKRDFENLRKLDLDQELKLGQAIDRLRALTHPPYKNAYFIDPESGKKVWVQLILKEEETEHDAS